MGLGKSIKKIGKKVVKASVTIATGGLSNKKVRDAIKKNAGTIGAVGSFMLGGPAGAAIGQSLGDVASGRGFSLGNTALAGGLGYGLSGGFGGILGGTGTGGTGEILSGNGSGWISNLLGGSGLMPTGSGAGSQTDLLSLLNQFGSNYASGVGADKGAKAYQDTIQQGIDTQKGYVNQLFGLAQGLPQQGMNLLNQTGREVPIAYEQGTATSPYFNPAMETTNRLQDIVMGRADWKTDPGYQFRLGEALRETERAAASRGYNKSGNVLTALGQRTQDVASNEYQNIINRLSTLQNQYAGQDINATGIMSGDRQSNRTGTLNYLSNLMGNQSNLYLGGAGVIGGLNNMYSNLAESNALEESAPWLTGSSYAASGGLSNLFNAGKSLYNLFS